jgi:hypothetical protein
MKVPVGAGLLALMTLLPLGGQAAFYDQSAESHRFGDEISYRVDTGTDSSFENVSSTADGWISQRQDRWRATGEPVRLWARFELPAVDTPRRLFLVTGPWERVEYFFLRGGELVGHQVAGALVPQSDRSIHVTMTTPLSLSGFVSLDVPANARTTAFVRLATDNRFVTMGGLRFSSWDEARVRAEEARDRLAQGVFLGIVLVLVVYNLALYWVDGRDASYPYFVTSLLCVTVMWLSASGLAFDLLWPEHPAWDRYAVWIASILGMYAMAQFVRRYLDLGKHMPQVDIQMK